LFVIWRLTFGAFFNRSLIGALRVW
jgi:hypothetical protein